MTENKSFTRDGKKVKEYYSNGELDMYFETESTLNLTITRGYSATGTLFSNVVVYLNKLGKPFMIYENVDQIPGHYRRINSEGKHSYIAYDTFQECMLHDGESLI